MLHKERVLFLCTANAARSQMAEALLRHTDPRRFEAVSAGTRPTEIDARTLATLQTFGIDGRDLRSKSIGEFACQQFDYVITLCDKAAQECRSFPGARKMLAWDFEDPALSDDPDAFRHTLRAIHERIKMFVLIKTKR